MTWLVKREEFWHLTRSDNEPTISRGNIYDVYEGWNFNSGNYLFTTDTK